MHTYTKKPDADVWMVGYYHPHAKQMTPYGDYGWSTHLNFGWVLLKEFTDERLAAAYASHLNGGNGEPVEWARPVA